MDYEVGRSPPEYITGYWLCSAVLDDNGPGVYYLIP